MTAKFDICRKTKPYQPWDTEREYWQREKTILSAEAEAHLSHIISPAVNVISRYWFISLVTPQQIKGFKTFFLGEVWYTVVCALAVNGPVNGFILSV